MNASNTAFPIPAVLSFCIQFMAQRGFDLDEVLAGTGLDDRSYAQPSTVLSSRQELAVYANIQRLGDLAGIDDIGLAIGAQINVNRAGMLGRLVANAADVGHAGYLMRRFHALSNRWFVPELIGALSPGKTIVRYRQTTEVHHLYRLLIDMSVRATQQVLVEVFGDAGNAFVSEVAFGYPEPAHPDHYQAKLNCPVSFGHDFTFVTFDNDIAGQVNHKRSEFAYHDFLQHCRDMAARLEPASWQQRVLNALSCIDTYPSATAMAATLNCSERSLRRHLHSEGVQYSELTDKIRADRAAYLLSHSRDSVKKIGYQLSYSEPAAFIHAFMRWTGTTPTAFRRAACVSPP